MHVKDVGTHTREGGERQKKGIRRGTSKHARARGNFPTLHASAQLPFDAAEDERSGCETLCSFVGRRVSGRARSSMRCHTSRGWRSVDVRVVVWVH